MAWRWPARVCVTQEFETIEPDDMCWQCHYHLHRCENCRYFDRIACLLDCPDRQSSVPGQQCLSFALLAQHAGNLEV
jgi:CBS domain-containing protein